MQPLRSDVHYPKKIPVQLSGKSRPVSHNLSLGKREYCYDDNWGIEEQEQQPQVALAKYAFNHLMPPSWLASSPAINVDAPMRKSMISESAAP